MFEGQVCLSICTSWFAYLHGILCAHPKDNFFQLLLQVSTKFLVIVQLTISIGGYPRSIVYHLRHIHTPGQVLSGASSASLLLSGTFRGH